MKLKMLLFVCFLSLIFAACEDKMPSTNTINTSPNTNTSNAVKPLNQNNNNTELTSTKSLTEPDYSAVPRSKNDNLTPEQLSKYIPLKIKGIKQGSFVKYQSDEGNGIITSCASTFDLDKMSAITITIIDNGPSATIRDLKYFDVLPNESGNITTRIALANGRGYSMWNKLAKNGSVAVLFNNRIIVKIDGRNVKDSYLPLESHLKLIDIDKILKNL